MLTGKQYRYEIRAYVLRKDTAGLSDPLHNRSFGNSHPSMTSTTGTFDDNTDRKFNGKTWFAARLVGCISWKTVHRKAKRYHICKTVCQEE